MKGASAASSMNVQDWLSEYEVVGSVVSHLSSDCIRHPCMQHQP